MSALFKIGYGLYVVTCREGEKDNGLIVNTVSQLTDNPVQVAVTVNKSNYSHGMIERTGKLNVNCLSVEAPFKVFEAFGFRSGRDVDKFADCNPNRSENGLVVLPRYINAWLSLEVERYVDLGTHGMFICRVTEEKVVADTESMTYAYYHASVKPRPQAKKKGYVCTICGYVYEGEELPEDFVCPLCQHGAQFFEEIK
ncbi:MAG: flavin reductase [Clostridia bacterium]|nr:flavin reductase [Clostridia bacterium]